MQTPKLNHRLLPLSADLQLPGTSGLRRNCRVVSAPIERLPSGLTGMSGILLAGAPPCRGKDLRHPFYA